ncbi:MAG: hypothetical protein ACI9BW_003052 [Gammaproteobacteria bacterium]|jgi:hypothetical protein
MTRLWRVIWRKASGQFRDVVLVASAWGKIEVRAREQIH